MEENNKTEPVSVEPTQAVPALPNLENIYKIFYRGFVEINSNKEPLSKYGGNAKLKKYLDTLTLKSYGGVLNQDTVFIDIDDMRESEILLKIITELNLNCRVTKTNRGRHFTFYNSGTHPIKNCLNHVKLTIGITADVKTGLKNAVEVLKINDTSRTIEREINLNAEIAKVPEFLIPIKSNVNFTTLDVGDGRNQNLFSYILNLQSNGFTKDEIKNILTLMNKYVLTTPLADNELNTIMRDEAFETPIFFEKNVFLHEKFSDYLINEYNVKRINGAIHIYQDGVYKFDNRLLENIMIKLIPHLTASRRMEVFKYLNAKCINDTPMSPANFILFNNGIYDINTDALIPNTPSYVITNQIPHNYNPTAYSEKIDMVLDNLADKNKNRRLLIEEMIGFTFYRRSEDGKCFILKGKASNGKSTLLKMIRTMLGNENTSSLDLNELDDRFSTIMLAGKLANIGDDISNEYIPNTSIFKKVVTGNRISAEQKGIDKIDFDPYCKLIFSANNIPRFGNGRDNSALTRRLVIIPLLATFNSESKNFTPYIIDDLLTENAMEYLIQIGLKGLKRWLENGKFTECEEAKEALEEFEVDNNPIAGFFEELENDGLDDSLDDHNTKEIYTRYCQYCDDNGHKALGQKWCTRQVKERYKNFSLVRRSIRENGEIKTLLVFTKNLQSGDKLSNKN